jgi:hypothetical protein
VIWKHRLERGEWIARDELHKRFMRSALEHLGGSLVMDHRDGRRECYRLTLLGVLLTADAPAIERLLERRAAGASLTAAETTVLQHVVAVDPALTDPTPVAQVARRALDSYNPELAIDGAT